MDRPTENHASNSVTVLLRSNVLLVAMKNEINKLLHSNGHLSIVAHVGSSHIFLGNNAFKVMIEEG
jgi:hypothetical protein